jgi:dGTPase
VPQPNRQERNPDRDRRLFEEPPKAGDERTPAERDYDRVIYTSAFMRLAGVSQVAHTADAAVVHNRLTHSLQVASVAKGLAQRLNRIQPAIVKKVGGINQYVVAAAAIAHDLGHPPFGHVAERVLDSLVRHELKSDAGFEGNPQSFRVVTKLAIRKRHFRGLNLTRATLNAMLKYPWMRESAGPKNKKWGAYHTDQEFFDFAREGFEKDQLCAEAEIMTFADDIAYATHDLEDYYRAGLLPIDRVLNDKTEQRRFLEGTFERWRDDGKEFNSGEFESAFRSIVAVAKLVIADLDEPYCGRSAQRAAIRSLGSLLIHRFFDAIRLRVPTADNRRFVEVDPALGREIAMLKQFMWHYVIPNRYFATQEYGQRVIIESLFEAYKAIVAEPGDARLDIFPIRYQEALRAVRGGYAKNLEETIRIIADVIADMTEHQAVQTYERLTGHSPGSFLDLLQR